MSNDHLKGQQAARFGTGAPTNSSAAWVSYNAETQRRQQQEAMERQRRQQQEAMERQRQAANQNRNQGDFGAARKAASTADGSYANTESVDFDEAGSDALRKTIAFIIVFVGLLVMTFGGAERLYGSTDADVVPGWYQAFALLLPLAVTVGVRKRIGLAALACIALLAATTFLL